MSGAATQVSQLRMARTGSASAAARARRTVCVCASARGGGRQAAGQRGVERRRSALRVSQE